MGDENRRDDGADGGVAGEVDLFGEPASEYRDPRGRKKIKINNELRDHIAVLAASGMDRNEIADAVGCSERTLRSYFLPELNEGKSEKKAEMLTALWNAGINGNVSAMKAWLAMTEKAGAVPMPKRPPREPKLGKKELVAREAETGHEQTDWADVLH